MKKIVFFYRNKNDITDGLLLYLNMAKYIADVYKEYEVYYINYYNENANKVIENSSVIFRDYTAKEVFKDLSDAVFVTQSNYLQMLINGAGELSESKILLWDWNSNLLSYWINQYDDDIKGLVSLLKETKSWYLPDENCILDIKKQFAISMENECIPYASNSECEHIRLREVIPNHFSIGWVGSITAENKFSFDNLVYNLEKLNGNSKFDVHIIGNNSAILKLELNSDKIRYITPSSSVNLKEYLAENINLVFAKGYAALECARMGIPVAIPCSAKKNFYTNKFIWLYDAIGYSLSYTHDNLRELNCNMYSLGAILSELNSLTSIQEKGQRCFTYVEENHSIEHIGELFIQKVTGTELRMKDCSNNEVIKKQKEAFFSYLNKNEDSTYEAFVSELGKAKALRQLGRYGKLKYLLKDIIWGKYAQTILIFIKEKMRAKRYLKIQDGYTAKVAHVKQKLEKEHKIKVAFIVLYEATFPGRPIFEKMLEDKMFDPYIVVTTDVSRGVKYMLDTYHKSISFFERKYPGKVVCGYDEEWDSYTELNENYSIVCFANMYPHMVHPYHEIQYFLKKNVLTLYVYYGFAAVKYGRLLMSSDVYNCVWKLFLDSEINRKDLKKYQPIRAKNAVVTSYIKMDELANVPILNRERKKIIICPHHTVTGWKQLDISNFLKYSELFVELPKMYPEIDFVFRPHPLLFINLVNEKIWSEAQITDYLDRMTNNKNIVYDVSGDYFDTFMNSDAMIHDCSSFIGEYLFTEKPCCYMLKSEKQIKEIFLPMGEMCMENYYKAYSKEEILYFIDDVVLGGNDPLKENREKFSREILKFNYPNSAEFAVNYIKTQITRT